MSVKVLKTAVVVYAAFFANAIGIDLSSALAAENLSRFCPVSTGQMAAHVCQNAVFTGILKRAEDTGVEPATHCWAIDFESTC